MKYLEKVGFLLKQVEITCITILDHFEIMTVMIVTIIMSTINKGIGIHILFIAAKFRDS